MTPVAENSRMRGFSVMYAGSSRCMNPVPVRGNFTKSDSRRMPARTTNLRNVAFIGQFYRKNRSIHSLDLPRSFLYILPGNGHVDGELAERSDSPAASRDLDEAKPSRAIAPWIESLR